MSELWAVEGDPNTHGGGELIAANPQTVFIDGIPVIEHSDPANPDSLCVPLGPPHCNPATANGSGTVFVYGNPVHRNNDDRVCGAKTTVTNQSTVFVGD
jgi:uncharacterized Zn-binding protein involved in type VI secretion